MNEENKSRKVTVRFSLEEYGRIEKRFKETSCRTLSEYLRDVVLNKKITTQIRDASLDSFMEELVLVRRELNALANNFNQVVRKINACQSVTELKTWQPECIEKQEALLKLIEIFQGKMNQLSVIWLQG